MPHAVPRLIVQRTHTKQHEVRWLENCCPAPEALALEPALPETYSAWIHRSGWMVYLHEPTAAVSWLHPGKLADLKARGAKDRNLWIKEKNYNRGGSYVLDYACAPIGEAVGSHVPTPWDFDEIDKVGFEAWRAKLDAECEKHRKRYETESGIVVDSPETQAKFAEWSHERHHGKNVSSSESLSRPGEKPG